MKRLAFLVLLTCLFFFSACDSGVEKMNLLDEKISAIKVSNSEGVGDMNLHIALTIDEQEQIKVIEKVIRSAVKKNVSLDRQPDYDVMVEYEGGLPTHAIHLWLGEEGAKSILMYMVGEGETYVTSEKHTERLRKILLNEK